MCGTAENSCYRLHVAAVPSGAACFHRERQVGVSRRSALSVMVLWLRCCLVHFVRRIGARTTGLTVFVVLLRSGVQCNAMTIDNALLGQNMVVSMDSATKHFILTFYEMKNLENS